MRELFSRGRVARYASAFIGLALMSFPFPTSQNLDAVFPIAGTTDNRCWDYKDSERGFARRINAERAQRGERWLSLDPELSKSARKHTREMVDRNLLYHTTSTDLRRRVSGWVSLGENVGVGGTVDSLHRAFMNSPGHRHNILYPSFAHVGIGVIQRDRMWVTVLFSSGGDPGTTLRMPRC